MPSFAGILQATNLQRKHGNEVDRQEGLDQAGTYFWTASSDEAGGNECKNEPKQEIRQYDPPELRSSRPPFVVKRALPGLDVVVD